MSPIKGHTIWPKMATHHNYSTTGGPCFITNSNRSSLGWNAKFFGRQLLSERDEVPHRRKVHYTKLMAIYLSGEPGLGAEETFSLTAFSWTKDLATD